MPKTFDPDTELPDLSGKVIVVTGGMCLSGLNQKEDLTPEAYLLTLFTR